MPPGQQGAHDHGGHRPVERGTDHQHPRHVRCAGHADRLASDTGTRGHDLEGADALLPAMVADSHAFLADTAYDAQERVLRVLDTAGVQAVIPPKSHRIVQPAYDKAMDKIRHVMENFCAQLKQCRGIATRYEKRASTFLGAIHLAAAVIWLN
jgi:transposase